MSDYRVLQDLTLHLRQLLFQGLTGDDEVSGNFTSINTISLASPAQLADGSGSGVSQPLLSLYLYQVLPNAHLNNRPLVPVSPGEQRYPPLSLDLFYLLTPLSTSPEDNLVILGRSMQILAANAIVQASFLDSDLRPSRPEVRVMINPVNLEELTRIWNAFNQSYQLSVCYQVHVVSIDTARAPEEGPPVVERLVDVHQIVQGNGHP